MPSMAGGRKTMTSLQINTANVNLAEHHQIQYWCEKLECTPAELRKAVIVVGDSPIAVARILESEKQFELADEVQA